jgi:hypothetical protein
MKKRRNRGILPLIGACIFITLWIGKMDFSRLRTVDYVELSAIALCFVCGLIMLARNWRSWRNPSEETETHKKPGHNRVSF